MLCDDNVRPDHILFNSIAEQPTEEELKAAAAEDAAAKQKAKAKATKERFAEMDKLNTSSASSDSKSRKGVRPCIGCLFHAILRW